MCFAKLFQEIFLEIASLRLSLYKTWHFSVPLEVVFRAVGAMCKQTRLTDQYAEPAGWWECAPSTNSLKTSPHLLQCYTAVYSSFPHRIWDWCVTMWFDRLLLLNFSFVTEWSRAMWNSTDLCLALVDPLFSLIFFFGNFSLET